MTDIREFDYFGNRISQIDRWRMQASIRVRRQIYDWFIAQIGSVSGKAILDHGSTPDTLRCDSNCFIRWCLEDGAKVYATSPEDITGLTQSFPNLAIVPYPPDPQFLPPIDYAISSAVIEHVGSEARQVEYVQNLLHLARGVLLTTPNRAHWLDFHTKLPLLHWLPRNRHRQILNVLGMKFWAKEENLRLLSHNDIAAIVWSAECEFQNGVTVDWYQPKFLGMVSNLVAFIQVK
ncbi:MAG TPA: hypothetical protein IGS17_17870 [Oscillatoriales cyanobacterium M59_W2019_021]|nr:hypothetical protein [Oscillatoriales cyanobacterium M59_W2019_021]